MKPAGAGAKIDWMSANDQLMAQISALLANTEGGQDPAQLERTLTDGYARALSLEAERSRLQRRIGKLTDGAARGESTSRRELASAVRLLKRHDGEIGSLRSELARLQRRHSSVVRELLYTSPDRTA